MKTDTLPLPKFAITISTGPCPPVRSATAMLDGLVPVVE